MLLQFTKEDNRERYFQWTQCEGCFFFVFGLTFENSFWLLVDCVAVNGSASVGGVALAIDVSMLDELMVSSVIEKGEMLTVRNRKGEYKELK